MTDPGNVCACVPCPSDLCLFSECHCSPFETRAPAVIAAVMLAAGAWILGRPS